MRNSILVGVLLCVGFGCGKGTPPATVPVVVVTDVPAPAQSSASWIRKLKSDHVATRTEAASVLGRLRPTASEAVPALLEVLQDSDRSVRGAAVYALLSIGGNPDVLAPAITAAIQVGEANPPPGRPDWASVVEWFRHALKDGTPGSRLAVLRLFDRQGWTGVLPVLIPALTDPDPAVREMAIRSIAEIVAFSPDVRTPELAAALTGRLRDPDEDFGVRVAAAGVLAQFGGLAVPVLAEALQDKSLAVRQAVAYQFTSVFHWNPLPAPTRLRLVADLLDVLARDPDPVTRGYAAKSLARFGQALPEVVAALVAGLKDSDASVRANAAEALGDLGPLAAGATQALVALLNDSNSRCTDSVLRALWSIGLGAREAVPSVIAILQGSSSREEKWSAIGALQAIGGGDPRAFHALHTFVPGDRIQASSAQSAREHIQPPPPAVLVAFLTDPDTRVQGGARWHLIKLKSAAVPALLSVLGNRALRDTVLYILSEIGPAADGAVPVLAELYRTTPQQEVAAFEMRKRILSIMVQVVSVRPATVLAGAVAAGLPAERVATEVALATLVLALSETVDRRWEVTDQLKAIGPPVIPALQAHLRHKDREVRACAFELLHKLAPATVEDWASGLQDADPGIRRETMGRLGGLGPAAKPFAPALVQALSDPDPYHRWSAAAALVKIDPSDQDAGAALGKLLAEVKATERGFVVETIGLAGPAASHAIPSLVKAIVDTDPGLRAYAAKALGLIGPGAKAATLSLVQAARDTNSDVRREAVRALGLIGPDAKDSTPALFKALWDPEVHDVAKAALAAIGASAVPYLLPQLKAEKADIRWRACTALEALGSNAAGAVPELSKSLTDMAEEVRWAAADALGAIGPAAKAAVEPLSTALKDAESTVRFRVARALGKLGATAKPAVPALREAVKDERRNVREAAAEAIHAIER